MTYQPGVPSGTIALNLDYLNIQGNFTSLNDQFNVDHVPLTSTSGSPPNGYHEAVHLVPVSTTSSNPTTNQPINGYTATPGYGQVLSAQINDGINTDQALYFLTGENRLIQLTRNFTPVSSGNGYTMLPGGLILQWGTVNSTANTFQTLNFATNNIAFPSNCFSVWTQPFGSSSVPGSQATVEIRKSTMSRTSFQWVFVTNSGEYTGFFWIALGN